MRENLLDDNTTSRSLLSDDACSESDECVERWRECGGADCCCCCFAMLSLLGSFDGFLSFTMGVWVAGLCRTLSVGGVPPRRGDGSGLMERPLAPAPPLTDNAAFCSAFLDALRVALPFFLSLFDSFLVCFDDSASLR
eukprot:TRINITY_DN2918_c0_g1_i2.p3 TRINITY_DN2918_c0_g1~~TRINITY_DN2918_c0_g1_i2.p3  ORF type:complete len:138 (-),score=18.91 TRINITY_DN2918_c0_g1_i2:1285-1698(-)